MTFYTGGSERMRIVGGTGSDVGYVGIGTTSPVNKLTVGGGVTLIPTYETYLVNAYYNSGWKYIGNGVAWGIGNNFGGATNGVTIAVASVNAGGANAALTWNPAFNIDTSGNVGIGTASPSTYGKLAVLSADDNNTIVAVASNGLIRMKGYLASAAAGVIEATNTAQSAYAPLFVNGSILQLGTGGSERMRITASGGVSFGASGTAYGTAGQVLTSNGDAAPTWATAAAGATGGSTDQIFWENGQTTTANYTISAGKNAGTFGPVTVNSGVVVTVPSGSVWTIV